MPCLKSSSRKIKTSHFQIAGVLFLIFLAIFLVWFGNFNSKQSANATAAQVRFTGEYRIGEGEWLPIEEGAHISASKGDVTLRMEFSLMTPDGKPMDGFVGSVPVAFYTDHVNLTFYDNGQKTHVSDNEHPIIGESACGENFTSHNVRIGGGSTTEIVVHNPHLFGNETAIDEMLSGLAIWGNMDFEKTILEKGETQRYVGILLMIVSLVFLGTALFSTLIHIKNSKIIWLLGIFVLIAGIYFSYSAYGVPFWSDSVISNTTLLGCSMMLYMLFLLIIIAYYLKKTRLIGNLTVTALAVANGVFFILPIVSQVYFYDTWIWWIGVQVAANIAIACCLVREIFASKERSRWLYIGAFLPLISFGVDIFGTWKGIWKGGVVSQYVFILLLAIATITVLKFIPHSINAATKAKELEMEKMALNAQLAESRISTMMSQIRPHFIYNTLGSIEQLCKLDPPKAGDLVHNFAKYLRGNFGELDNPKPILMSQEMEHVRHYVSIENVRFPDMTFTFEMNSDDFHIPALTIQPIVENAIKHGLMKLQKGGTIRVVSYETEESFFVSVEDDGVGFDTSLLLDDRKHVGLRNIRERLKVMVSGTLDIESAVGVGTKVIITIPKEDNKR